MSDPGRAGPASTPEHRLRLLWDPPRPSTRGRPASRSLDDVIQAGIEVADASGLAGVSMRRVAQHLGTGAMSLYTYVSGREELVELMTDRVHGELAAAGGAVDGAVGWRAALTAHALGLWALYRRHPWLVEQTAWRPPLGPHVLDTAEAGYRTLVDSGLAPRDVVECVDLVVRLVGDLARAANAADAGELVTGLSVAQYRAAVNGFWASSFDVARFPTMTRIWQGGGFDAVDAGPQASLDRVLDVVAVLVEDATGA